MKKINKTVSTAKNPKDAASDNGLYNSEYVDVENGYVAIKNKTTDDFEYRKYPLKNFPEKWGYAYLPFVCINAKGQLALASARVEKKSGKTFDAIYQYHGKISEEGCSSDYCWDPPIDGYSLADPDAATIRIDEQKNFTAVIYLTMRDDLVISQNNAEMQLFKEAAISLSLSRNLIPMTFFDPSVEAGIGYRAHIFVPVTTLKAFQILGINEVLEKRYNNENPKSNYDPEVYYGLEKVTLHSLPEDGATYFLPVQITYNSKQKYPGFAIYNSKTKKWLGDFIIKNSRWIFSDDTKALADLGICKDSTKYECTLLIGKTV
jgi:hypothetical protein